MIIIQTVLAILSILCFGFLVLPFFTVLLSRFTREKVRPAVGNEDRQFDMGCIITAYKNANITKPLVQSLIDQRYADYHIYLVADECDVSDWDIHHDKLTVFRPDPPLRLKAKSIIHAMDHFVRPHDYTLVFDADNLAHPDFLNVINRYAQHGLKTIQGQRTAKNLDSVYACADSTGEFYKNYTERYAPYLIGSSSVISGSGMAVKTDLYRAYLESPEIAQGKEKWKKMLQEDKILQNFLLRQNEKISYAWDAVVYDEKVTTGEQVETQRSRWLYSYFQNIPNSLGILRRGIFGFSWNQIHFGLVTISPPMFVLLAISFLLGVLMLFFNPVYSLLLVAGLALFSLNVLWTLKLSKVPPAIWKALWSGIPLFILRQVRALFKMGNPNKNFKHTEHNRTLSIDEVLKGQE